MSSMIPTKEAIVTASHPALIVHAGFRSIEVVSTGLSREFAADQPLIAMRDQVLRLQLTHHAQLDFTWPPAGLVGRA